MNGYRVKVCGLTRLEDALLAWELGAWAIGLVFAPSPRQVTLGLASELVRGLRSQASARRQAGDGAAVAIGGFPSCSEARVPFVVGVFTDSSPAEIAEAVGEVGLDGIQLHGEKGPAASAVRPVLQQEGCSAFIIQAVPIEPGQEDEGRLARAVTQAAHGADLVLLDSRVRGRFGGTATPFTWSFVGKAGLEVPFLVAGGIRPDNVRAALLASGACGVDVSSGVELAPGVKDPELMRRLFQEVRKMSQKQGYTGKTYIGRGKQ